MPAPTAPTSLAINQIYTRTDDEFWLAAVTDPYRMRSLPQYEERWIELRWTETEAGDCEYIIKQGADTIQRIPKGISRAQVMIGRRDRQDPARKTAGRTLPDWGANFSATFSVLAINDDGESSAATLSVTQALETVENAILPIQEFSTATEGGLLRWQPDGVGSLGTYVQIFAPRGIWPTARVFLRAPGVEIRIPHRGRVLVDDDISANVPLRRTILQSSSSVFINGQKYSAQLSAMVWNQQIYRKGRDTWGYVAWKTPLESRREITWANAPTAMVLTPQQVRPLVGVEQTFEIPINVTGATWSITSTPPSWVTLDEDTGLLSMVPPNTTPVTLGVSATKDTETKSTQIQITPRPRPEPPRVSISRTHLANGYSFRQGETINIEPVAARATQWRATLPEGLQIDEQRGRIFGSMLEIGRYAISVQAKSTDSDWSAPLELPIKITAVPANVDLASVRFDWLQREWKLTDLQVQLVDRSVSTSRLVTRTTTKDGPAGVQITQARKTLVLKPRDTIKFAVLFLIGNVSQTVADLEKIRIGIRPENNVDEPFFLESDDSPTPVEIEGAVYYLLQGELSQDAGDIIMDTLRTKNEPLPAIADVEWTVDGEVFSSQTFPVDLELDVARDG